VDVLPKSPLPVGRSYTFEVGAVTDANGVAHAPSSLAYTIAQPKWTYWSSDLSTGALPPDPGVAVGRQGPVVFAIRYGTCNGGTWIMNPDAGGQLVAQSRCDAIYNQLETSGRKGLLVNGSVWGVLSLANNELLQQEASGWLGWPDLPYVLGTDGTSLIGTWGPNYALVFTALDPACNGSWCQETVDGSGGYNHYYTASTGGEGRLFAGGSRTGTSVYSLDVFERGDGGAWAPLPGAAASQGVDSSQSLIPLRMAYAKHDPLVVYSTQAGISALSAAAWSSASKSWTVYRDIGPGASSSFDVVTRGDTAYLVAVLAGQAHVRAIDLAAAAPAFVDIAGPSGPALNTCTAGHPEAFITDDSLWVTWYEECVSGTFQVFLAQWM
jgi:hypothetical protein